MRTFLDFLSFIFLVLIVWLSFGLLTPKPENNSQNTKHFSIEKAKNHVREIAKKPHFVGSDEHSKVRNYILNELYNLDISTHTQQGVSLNKDAVFTIPENIVAHISGTGQAQKSLLILSHYDSAPHSSYGASDDASGVAVILEWLRIIKEEKQTFKNDIIVLFSDAEELGLNGAQLFVEKHPLAKDVGLVLNFEARGSGGPSNMILETNHGNANLIKDFSKIKMNQPLTNSLMYSVYKLLPNDTDATVFREKSDIPSFFFAFIDDHFDYHTALDKPENLNDESLLHQFQYLQASINQFGNSDLEQLLVEDDHAYFSLPYIGIIHFDYFWAWPLFACAIVLYIFLIFQGRKIKRLRWRSFLKFTFIWLTILVAVSGLLYGLWQLILIIYPEYSEILHGFTYNGHDYIFAFSFLSIAILFAVFHKYARQSYTSEIAISGLSFWLLLILFINIYLKGATFFIIPLLISQLILLFDMTRFKSKAILQNILTIPIIFILCQYVLFFPVGLGIEMLMLSGLFIILIFILIYPIFHHFKFKKILSVLFLIGSVFFFIKADFSSDFSENRPKPNSLIYHVDLDEQKAYWHTYDDILDEWTSPYFKDILNDENKPLIQSKYNSLYKYTANAEFLNFPSAQTSIEKLKNKNGIVNYQLKIKPSESTKRLIVSMNKSVNFENFSVNEEIIPFKNPAFIHPFYNRNKSTVIDYYVVQNEALELNFSLKENLHPDLYIRQINYDLLDNAQLKVSKRSNWMMPKPFVINDAIMTTQKIKIQ
ncbi:MAG: M20/M25/M40 family metallo-hydrolase [Psychroflexus halocasei]